MTAWSEDDWHDAWVMLTGQWPTLRREGAEAGYRHALTRFAVDEVATMILRFVESSDDEPKAATIADAIRAARAEATRREERAAARTEVDDQRHDPASASAAWRIAQNRQERRQGLGLAQWIALGCPPDGAESLRRVVRVLASGYGAFARAGLRAAHEHDRALALRRLASVMQPDDHALLVDEVTP